MSSRREGEQWGVVRRYHFYMGDEGTKYTSLPRSAILKQSISFQKKEKKDGKEASASHSPIAGTLQMTADRQKGRIFSHAQNEMTIFRKP